MEEYILSLDVSTSNVGIALWSSEGKLIELKHLSLKLEKDVDIDLRDLHKANLFRDYIKSYKERIEKDLNGVIKHAFIEAPLQNTPKNINTTALLLGFNGMARYILMQVLNIMPVKISVYESRKLFCPELVKVSYRKGERVETLSFPEKYRKDKKKYIWEKVAKLEPQIKWFYTRNDTLKDFCYDLSDSYAVGFAGLKLLNIVK